MTTASLDGVAASRCVVQIPSWGAWWADVDLTEDKVLSGAVALVVGSATLRGTIMSGGAFDGRAAYRVVGGAGGWGKDVSALAYANDAGVKGQTVASDAARAVGERIGTLASAKPGGHFARTAGPASLVMHALYPRNWYVDFEGVTQAPARTTAEIRTTDARTRVDLAAGVVELATDDPAPYVPGVVLDGRPAAVDVEWEITSARATARIMFGPVRARRLEAWAKIISLIDPRARYRGLTEYRVVSRSGDRYNLQVIRSASGMPDLARVPDRTLSGADSVLALGAPVLVAFVEGAPWLPAIISHSAVGDTGWIPQELLLGGPPRLGAARITDAVQAGPFAGVITGSSIGVKIGP